MSFIERSDRASSAGIRTRIARHRYELSERKAGGSCGGCLEIATHGEVAKVSSDEARVKVSALANQIAARYKTAMAVIEVRVAGKGSTWDGEAMPDANVTARCDLCAQEVDVVVSTGASASAPFACKGCLRNRLEAVTIALWLLDERGGRGLPWGKISG